MDTSIFLARIIGPLFILVGIGVLMNTKHYGAMATDFIKNAELYYFSGATAFVAGMAIVLHHNLWVADWRVVITILGWISIVKGTARILFPMLGAEISGSYIKSEGTLRGGSILIMAIGAWLAYKGFYPA